MFFSVRPKFYLKQSFFLQTMQMFDKYFSIRRPLSICVLNTFAHIQSTYCLQNQKRTHTCPIVLRFRCLLLVIIKIISIDFIQIQLVRMRIMSITVKVNLYLYSLLNCTCIFFHLYQRLLI